MTDPRFQHVFAVVPAYNEAGAVGGVIADLARYLAADHVLVVDDGSRDDTAAAARRAGAVVLRHLVNRGQGAALATGIQAALRRGARIIVTFDADGQHRADDLPIMLEPVLRGEADVVLGTRFGHGASGEVPRRRRLVLRLAVAFTRLVSLVRVTDAHNGYRAFSAEAARTIRLHQDGMAHASEFLEEIRRRRLRYVERPVRIVYSEYSLAKGQRNRAAWGLAWRVLWSKLSR